MEFMVSLTKRWRMPKKVANVFPVFVPTSRHIVHIGEPRYEELCKWLLLQNKPGCYLDNVGQGYAACEEEPREFTTSPLCHMLVKSEFAKSQIVRKKRNDDTEEDPLGELGVELDQRPENAAPEDWMDCYTPGGNGNDIEGIETGNFANLNIEYADDDIGAGHDVISWDDAQTLGLSDGCLKDLKSWLDTQKRDFQVANLNAYRHCQAENLNTKHKLVYGFVTTWAAEKKSRMRVPVRST